ncbi:MAG: OmpP1/FadL family transporter [Thermoguttaceae bacterium]
MRQTRIFVVMAMLALLASGGQQAHAQLFGVDVHNTINPASGAMGGASLARPQDVQSAVAGNPSTLSEFRGSQFSLGGVWSEPTFDVTHDGSVTGVPFSGKSSAQGCLLPTIGAIQDLSSLGVPGSLGLGVTTLSGVSEQFTNEPGSLGTHTEFLILGFTLGAGIDVTERLSFGSSLTLGDGYTGGGFMGNGIVTHDYGLRGTFGFDYDLTCNTTLGTYYQTKMPFRYDNLLYLAPPGVFIDVEIEQPENFGVGIANTSLMGGDLLLAVDVLFKSWDNAAYWSDLYEDQWVVSLGTQLTRGRWKYRLGYAYADNPIDRNPGATINGVPIGQALVEYYQATQAGVISQHRVTGGIGIEDVLPGVSLDLFAGGMLPETTQFGTHTTVSLEEWFIGGGITWKFGQPRCETATGLTADGT